MAVTWKKLAYEDDVITKALLTAKGDIIHATAAGTPAALAIGTDNQMLRVDTDILAYEDVPAAAAHKDDHDPNDGADPLDCAAAGEIIGVAAAAEGSAHSFARSDHTHQVQHSIADNHVVTVDDATPPSDDEIAVFTASGIEGQTPAEVAATMALDDIGNPDAAVGFNGQQATDLVLENSAEPPATPVVGKIYFDTDLSVYVCTVAA